MSFLPQFPGAVSPLHDEGDLVVLEVVFHVADVVREEVVFRAGELVGAVSVDGEHAVDGHGHES